MALLDSVNLLQWKPPTRDQDTPDPEGACSGEASVEVPEFYQKKLGVTPFVLGSPQFNYTMSREKEGWLNRDSGTYLSDALMVLVNHGMAPEPDDPYQKSTEFVEPSDQAKTDAARFKVASIHRLDISNAKMSDVIAQALAGGDIVPVAAKFNTAFYNPEKFGSTAVVDYTKGSMAPNEAHAFVFLGYIPSPHNDGTRWFIMQNSWGVTWGGWIAPMDINDGGVAYMTEETVNALVYEAYTVKLPSVWPAPSQPKPNPQTLLKATFQRTSVPVGQNNLLTITGTPNAKYDIKVTGPAEAKSLGAHGLFDDIGLSTVTYSWPTAGEYTFVITSGADSVTIKATWK